MTIINKFHCVETSLVVQWLRLCTSNAGDEGSIPGQGTKILHVQCDQKKNSALHEHGLWHHKTIIIVLSKITVTDHHNKFNSNESFEISPELPK